MMDDQPEFSQEIEDPPNIEPQQPVDMDETFALVPTRESQGTPGPDHSRVRRIFWQGRFAPAFWTITGILSLTVNLILIVILFFLGKELFSLKGLVSDQLIGGLYQNFILMDEAVIETTVIVDDTILVSDTIPVVFTLPLEQDTIVELTEDTFIEGAVVSIVTPFFTLNKAPTNITLPAGTMLPVALNLDVPVETTIPISITVPVVLEVPVTIPLNQTELHEPFVGLQEVLGPYNQLLGNAPNSWPEALCATGSEALCEAADGGN